MSENEVNMTTESQIVVALSRAFDDKDEKAILRLKARWLVYNVKILRKTQGTEIKFFHSKGAKSDLLKELSELFPGEHMTEM